MSKTGSTQQREVLQVDRRRSGVGLDMRPTRGKFWKAYCCNILNEHSQQSDRCRLFGRGNNKRHVVNRHNLAGHQRAATARRFLAMPLNDSAGRRPLVVVFQTAVLARGAVIRVSKHADDHLAQAKRHDDKATPHLMNDHPLLMSFEKSHTC